MNLLVTTNQKLALNTQKIKTKKYKNNTKGIHQITVEESREDRNMCVCLVTSVVSNTLQPYEPWPAGILCPWDSPGKNSGEGCHFLLQI